MSQGNANRISIGVGTAGTSDVFTTTLPLDTRWDIVPNSVYVYTGQAGVRVSWGTQYLVARDDGAGNIVGQGAYAGVTGTINYATGDITVDENGVAAFDAGVECHVQYYERFPTSPADDFYASYACGNYNQYPLNMHRYAHASFADKNLVNHGTWCMRAQQNYGGSLAVAQFYLRDPDFYTDRPIMSEIAFRMVNNTWAPMCPKLVQRCEVPAGGDVRTGYYCGPHNSSGANWMLGLQSGLCTTNYQYLIPGETLGSARYNVQTNLERTFIGNVNNTPPNVLSDDWHKLRMITTMDADPGDVHIQILMALGYAEVDNASPTFQNVGDVWHLAGNNTPIWTPDAGFPSFEDHVYSWVSQPPHAYPPIPGYQGFVVGGNAVSSPTDVYFDDFRCYRMPA